MTTHENDRMTGTTRGRRGGRIAIGIAALAVVFLAAAVPLKIRPFDAWVGGLFGRDAGTSASVHKQLWTCGMHPQVIQDHPGDCPICHMKLVPLRTDAADATQKAAADTSSMAGMSQASGGGDAGAAAGGERKILFYRNPMDPTITSPVPAKDDMGMDYVPVYADEANAAAKQGATVTIDPTVQQNMNVVTAVVSRGDLRREIRTVGYLDYDQDRMISVTTRYTGFIEKSHIDHVGQPVRKGQPLLEIYSPELLQTEQELLSARDYVSRLADAPAAARQRAEALLAAARDRLGYWNITPAQVAEIEKTGKIRRTLTVVAPASGVVMKLMPGLTGMAVKPGMELLHIAGMADLWLDTEVFDEQLPWVKKDSEVRATLTYFPGESFAGKVRYVSPEVSEKTRTVQVTIEFPNPDGRLRAGMYATVTFAPVVAHDVVTVPDQAVLRTGERDVVITALGGGRFAPRDVTLGAAGDGVVEVREGLSAGERIVVSGQFLIDSESNLRAAIQQMIAEKRQH